MTDSGTGLEVGQRDFFGVPFLSLDLPGSEALAPDLMAVAHDLSEGDAALVDPNPMLTRFGDLTASGRNLLGQEDRPGIPALRQQLTAAIAPLIHHLNRHFWPPEVGPGDVVVNYTSWMHLTRRGGWHSAHCHPNSAWSGIYTVDPGDTSGSSGHVRFHNPATLVYHDPSTAFLNGAGWRAVDVEPVSGRVLLFPSFVVHEVLPYEGGSDRVTINFNMTFGLGAS